MKTRLACVLLLSVLVRDLAIAQRSDNDVNRGFEILAGAGMPMEDFAHPRDGGAAELGYLVGARYTIPLGNGQGFLGAVGLFLSATASVNTLDLQLLEDIEGVTASADPWKQLWPMAGIKKTFVLSDVMSQDLTVGLGAVVTQSPNIDVTYGGGPRIAPATVNVGSATAVGFAFDIGTSIVIRRHVTLGFGVLSGHVQYDATVTRSGAESRTASISQDPLLLRMNLGYIF